MALQHREELEELTEADLDAFFELEDTEELC